MATTGTRPERADGHIGTEIRPRLLREAAAKDIPQRAEARRSDAAWTTKAGRLQSPFAGEEYGAEGMPRRRLYPANKGRRITCQQPRYHVSPERCSESLGVKGA